MAIRKSTRTNPPAQPNKTKHRTHPHHLETELFDTLHQFNRSFGSALCALERINTRFSGPNGAGNSRDRLRKGLRDAIHAYCTRMGELRAQANRDLFRVLSGLQDHSAVRFSRMHQSRA